MNKPIKLRLTLDIAYIPNGESLASLKDRLVQIGENAANLGLMTGDGPSEVDKWTQSVVQIEN